jgi:hypothetical protein
LLLFAKADGIYSRTESGVEKRLLQTVVGGGYNSSAAQHFFTFLKFTTNS